MTVHQNCSNRSAMLNKMAARAKNRKTFERTSSPEPEDGFWNNYTWMFLGWPSTKKCSNDSAMMNKMAARAINRNKLLTTSSAKSADRFWKNFTGMFLRWLSTNAQTVLLLRTRWLPELKIEKPLNDFSSLTSASILKWWYRNVP